MNQEEKECSYDEKMQAELNEFAGTRFNDFYPAPENNIKTTCENNVNYEFQEITKEEQDKIIESFNQKTPGKLVSHPEKDNANFIELFKKWDNLNGNESHSLQNDNIRFYNLINDWIIKYKTVPSKAIRELNQDQYKSNLILSLKNLVSDLEFEKFQSEPGIDLMKELSDRASSIVVNEKLVEKHIDKFDGTLEIASKHSENCKCTYCEDQKLNDLIDDEELDEKECSHWSPSESKWSCDLLSKYKI